MGIKEKMAALLEERDALLKKSQENIEDWSDADEKRAGEVVEEFTRLKALQERQDSTSKMFSSLGREEQQQDASSQLTGSVGERFVKSDGYQGFRKSLGVSGEISDGTPINIRSVVGKADVLHTDSASLVPAPQFTEDAVYRAPRTLLSMVTRGTTDATYLPYRQVIEKASSAAIVAEATTTDGKDAAGGLKPLSKLTTAPAEAKVYTYADGLEVTTQELKDDGAIAAIIDSMLAENLEIELERVLINGTGTGIEPKGILATTGVQNVAFNTDMVTSVRKGLTKLQSVGVTPTALLLNPEDEEAWDLLKGTDGHFLGAGPFAVGPASAWGVPRIASVAVPKGKAIMGDFRTVQLLDRDPLEIVAFNQHKDYAQRNLVYIRAERRAMQLIRKPAALAVIELGGASE